MAQRPALSSSSLHPSDSTPPEGAPPESSSGATSTDNVTTASEPGPTEIQLLSTTVCDAAATGNKDRIVYALSGRTPEVIKRILSVKSNINQLPPLALAVKNGHLCVVEVLLNEFNADVEERFQFHLHKGAVLGTTLSIAAIQGRLDIVKCLVDCGADVNKVSQNCQSALQAAWSSGHKDIIQYLVERGARSDLVDETGSTCLINACREDNTEVVKLLLELGVDSNQISDEHQTAMHIAVDCNAVGSAKLLLEHGATMIKNKYGRTHLVEAILSGSRELIDIILRSSAVSRQERVDALELWGAVCISDGRISEGFRHLDEAMRERFKDPSQNLHKCQGHPVPAIDGVSESLTLADLQSRRDNHVKLMMESVLIWERILCHRNANYPSICWRVIMSFLQMCCYREALVVWTRQWKHFEGYYYIQLSDMRRILDEMWESDSPPAFEVFAEILDVILTDLETSRVQKGDVDFFMVHGLCICLLSCALGVKKGDDELRQVKNFAKRLVQKSSDLRYPPLHQAIENIQNFNFKRVTQLNTSSLVEILLESGADINARDREGNTPLHAVADVMYDENLGTELLLPIQDALSSVTRVLMMRGAHAASPNNEGQTPLDLANPCVQEVLQESLPLSLKCLAASTILIHKIPYKEKVPKIVQNFIELHLPGRKTS